MNRSLLIAAGAIACLQAIPEASPQTMTSVEVERPLQCAQTDGGYPSLVSIPQSMDQCAKWEFSPSFGAISMEEEGIALLEESTRPDSLDPLDSIRAEILSASALAKNAIDMAQPAQPKPVTGIVIAKAEIPEYQDITRIVQSWAQSWSKKDVNAYFGYYAKDFNTGEPKTTIEQWRQQRRQRIGKSGNIEVKVRDLKIELASAETADVVFTQEYRAAGRLETSRKSMQLKRQDLQWRIVSERAEP